jgi:murein L,D-transpeptidase YafK
MIKTRFFKLFIQSLFICACVVAICFFVYQYYSPSYQAPPPVIHKPMAKVDNIIIEKSKHIMTLYHQQEPIRTYRVALGFSPQGHKEQEGDGKTPEGRYFISAKNPKSMFYLSLKISYPSKADKIIASQKGVHPGGDIMIHGVGENWNWVGANHTLRDWTLGCIAVTNQEIEELYQFTAIGTPVEIKP